ncbi:hypothetical protein SBP02_07280 [Pseudomonas benzenivorans]|uniref:Uncharacterized protein n=1 Tax=Pseudomonas benzenivorans TaxID=556533 RepID=A0ABZ0Q199_9PSED|nr:hypothetical protein [Pseudomonas benzenivorans]WPC06547.1 hypothetical protein SBP02_07280 [Pseudomonas benzenivorans]
MSTPVKCAFACNGVRLMVRENGLGPRLLELTQREFEIFVVIARGLPPPPSRRRFRAKS